MRVLHVITGLKTGGAEMMLLRTVEELRKQGVECAVASVTGHGAIAEKLLCSGVQVADLGVVTPVQAFRAPSRLRRVIEHVLPDIVHSWMYHANVLTHLAVRGIKRTVPVVTSIHHSLENEKGASVSRRLARRLDARLSRGSASIFFASSRGLEQHIAYGYPAERALFLPNGFDVERFVPNPDVRRKTRVELGVGKDEFLVGCVARVAPEKDHRTFLRAAREFSTICDRARFVLVGRGVSPSNEALLQLVEGEGVRERVILLGERPDIPALLAAMDVACLSSVTEGFPLVLGEAMASGLSCVATNVGDCALLLGDEGIIVPRGDHVAIAQALRSLDLLGPEGRESLGLRARTRVMSEFSMDRYLSRLRTTYQDAISG